jgi:hypothetical protein
MVKEELAPNAFFARKDDEADVRPGSLKALDRGRELVRGTGKAFVSLRSGNK